MNGYKLLIDLHKHGHRQGPGGDAETEQALNLAGVDRSSPLKVADIGCGTGASALHLARLLNARITAVDSAQEFLDILKDRAVRMGVADRITAVAGSMDDLPFDDALLADMPALEAAIDELVAQHPHYAARRPRGDVGQGTTGSDAGTVNLAGLLRARA